MSSTKRMKDCISIQDNACCCPIALHILSGLPYKKGRKYCKKKGGYKRNTNGTKSSVLSKYFESNGFKEKPLKELNAKTSYDIMSSGYPCIITYHNNNNGHGVVWNGWRLLDVNYPGEICIDIGITNYKTDGLHSVSVPYVMDIPYHKVLINRILYVSTFIRSAFDARLKR